MWLNHGSGTKSWPGHASRRAGVLALIVSVAGLIGAGALQAQRSRALHTSYVPIVTTAPPSNTTSYYIESVNPPFFSKLGCAAAVELAERRINDGVVILFFGRPAYQETVGYGTQLLGQKGPFASIAQIQAVTVAWVDGFLDGYSDGSFHCKPSLGVCPRLTLALSTSNQPLYIQIPVVSTESTAAVIDPDPDMQSHGNAWARLVNALGDRIAKRGAAQFLSAGGANDIEFAWNSPRDTRPWVNGYIALARYRYYNVGSCDGCPERLADVPTSDPYAFDWTAADIWAVSAQGTTQVLPQSYNELGTQAR